MSVAIARVTKGRLPVLHLLAFKMLKIEQMVTIYIIN